jgi:hypothetical protein
VRSPPLRPDDLEPARSRSRSEREVMGGEDQALEPLAPLHGGHEVDRVERAERGGERLGCPGENGPRDLDRLEPLQDALSKTARCGMPPKKRQALASPSHASATVCVSVGQTNMCRL